MRYRWPLAFLTLLAITPNIYATITCGKPQLSKPTDHHPIYHFKAEVKCKIVGETINLQQLKDAYRDEIVDKKSQFKVNEQHAYDDKKGMTGYWLDATQSYDSPQGPRVVRAEIILADDKASNFYMKLKSKYVKGQNDAQFNKSILNEVKLQTFPDHADLTVIKEIDVEEPWYAPHGTFFDTVEADLSEAIVKSAPLQAEKITGKKVDAMRK